MKTVVQIFVQISVNFLHSTKQIPYHFHRNPHKHSFVKNWIAQLILATADVAWFLSVKLGPIIPRVPLYHRVHRAVIWLGELAPCSARRVPSPVCAEFGSLFRYIFDPKWRCGIRGNSYLLCCCCCCCHRMAGYPCIANNRLCIEKVTRRHTGVSEFGTWKMLKSGASSPTYITTLCTLCFDVTWHDPAVDSVNFATLYCQNDLWTQYR